SCSQIWTAKTDAGDQVAGYSSRGNVGIGFEGEFGRYKPDVVAPGSFVISLRSSQWDEGAYYNPTNRSVDDSARGIVLGSHATYNSVVFVADNTVQLIVRVVTNAATLALPVSVTAPPPSGTVTTRANVVSLPPDGALDEVGFWLYSVSNPYP